MSTATFHEVKLAKTAPHEDEILDFILYNKVLSNVITNNKIIFKFWSIKISWKIMKYTS